MSRSEGQLRLSLETGEKREIGTPGSKIKRGQLKWKQTNSSVCDTLSGTDFYCPFSSRAWRRGSLLTVSKSSGVVKKKVERGEN